MSNRKRIAGRISPESFDAWHEITARTGASISSLLEVLGPFWLRMLDEPVEGRGQVAAELIAEALRVQAERSRRE